MRANFTVMYHTLVMICNGQIWNSLQAPIFSPLIPLYPSGYFGASPPSGHFLISGKI
jgi:hypothetical protein